MKGSMRSRRPGVWELRVPGKSLTFHGSKTNAGRELRALVARAEAGEFSPARRRLGTVGQLLDQWVADHRDEWSPKTTAGYVWFIDRHLRPHIGDRHAGELRPVELADLYRLLARNVGAPTARRAHKTLRAAFAHAVRYDLLTLNPCERVVAPRPTRPRSSTLTLEQARAIIEHAEQTGAPEMALLVRLAALTGARRGELAALRWPDVNLLTRQVTFWRALIEVDGQVIEKGTKTGKVKTLTLDERTADALESFYAKTGELAGFVFHRSDGRPWSPSMITARWARLSRAAGVDRARFHDLRHANATFMVAEGIDPAEAARRLGHSTKTLLDTYAHPRDDTTLAERLAAQIDAG